MWKGPSGCFGSPTRFSNNKRRIMRPALPSRINSVGTGLRNYPQLFGGREDLHERIPRSNQVRHCKAQGGSLLDAGNDCLMHPPAPGDVTFAYHLPAFDSGSS